MTQATTAEKATCNTLIKHQGQTNATTTDNRSDVKDSRDSATFESKAVTANSAPENDSDEADEEDADADINLDAKSAEASGTVRIGSGMSSR